MLCRQYQAMETIKRLAEEQLEATSPKRICTESSVEDQCGTTSLQEQPDVPSPKKVCTESIIGDQCNTTSLKEQSDLTSPEKVCTKPNSTGDGSPSLEEQTDRTHSKKVCTGSSVTSEKSDKQEDNFQASGLLEKDVGISAYLMQHQGFRGILKQRYSDFLVYERSKDGVLVKLDDISKPTDFAVQVSNEPDEDYLQDTDKQMLQELLESKDKSKDVIIKLSEDSKDRRTKIHQSIRQVYPGLVSETTDVDGERVIKVTCKDNSKGRKSQNRGGWPKDCPNYCCFVLYKENKDTMDAINLISKLLRKPSHLFSFAGTKDKRAITVQELTAYRMHPSQIFPVNKLLRNMKVGNFRYCKDSLGLGDLTGNHFVITLRNVQGEDDVIENCLSLFRDNGFVNYFGMQRFGSTNIPTHYVGKALLHSDWNLAIELILKPRQGDSEDMSEVRKHWWQTKDAKSTLEKLKNVKSYYLEYSLLKALDKYGDKDPLKVLYAIPKGTRLMYVHSYQSYIWNCILSRRIKSYGMKPIIGDLVQKNNSSKYLTQDNINDYSIYDIVLPLPGYDITYPHNEVADWYKEMLMKDNIHIDGLKHKVRDYSLTGNYRKIIVKSTDSDWSIIRYDDLTIPLALSDLNKLEDSTLSVFFTDGKFKAVKVEFSLPSSSYATMAIREIIKCDTSVAFQRSLNAL
uniref:Pseudouridylate synthase 7 homolog n=1 Tax=Saccoglossus kowalevskii TaxID=10224 RepID=A0ABM0H0P9_SACKO|nr:PREDICTED: pseudouridylate synthase 7 homolog [Saccoglossus kowalevskii]